MSALNTGRLTKSSQTSQSQNSICKNAAEVPSIWAFYWVLSNDSTAVDFEEMLQDGVPLSLRQRLPVQRCQ